MAVTMTRFAASPVPRHVFSLAQLQFPVHPVAPTPQAGRADGRATGTADGEGAWRRGKRRAFPAKGGAVDKGRRVGT